MRNPATNNPKGVWTPAFAFGRSAPHFVESPALVAEPSTILSDAGVAFVERMPSGTFCGAGAFLKSSVLLGVERLKVLWVKARRVLAYMMKMQVPDGPNPNFVCNPMGLEHELAPVVPNGDSSVTSAISESREIPAPVCPFARVGFYITLGFKSLFEDAKNLLRYFCNLEFVFHPPSYNRPLVCQDGLDKEGY